MRMIRINFCDPKEPIALRGASSYPVLPRDNDHRMPGLVCVCLCLWIFMSCFSSFCRSIWWASSHLEAAPLALRGQHLASDFKFEAAGWERGRSRKRSKWAGRCWEWICTTQGGSTVPQVPLMSQEKKLAKSGWENVQIHSCSLTDVFWSYYIEIPMFTSQGARTCQCWCEYLSRYYSYLTYWIR